MGLLDFLWKRRVCPHCRQKGARQFLWLIKCANVSCPNYVCSLPLDPVDFSPTQDSRAFRGTFYAHPRRRPKKGEVVGEPQVLPQDFDPGENSITFQYRNFRGENRDYVGDKRTLRVKKKHISICLVPTGRRVTFSKKFLQNLPAFEPLAQEQPIPSARERQVLSYHKKRGTTSPLYESLRRKYPNW